MPTANRPLSPHLQVYRPQLTTILSITHRATGIALSVGAVYLVWELVAAASGPDSFDTFQRFAGSWIGLFVLFGWSASLFYHLLCGIRHLFWDAGYGFTLEATYRSGRWVIAGTLILTILAWIAGVAAIGGR